MRQVTRILCGLLLSVGPASLSPSSGAQVIKVRVVSAKNGQPLSKEPVQVSLLYAKGEKMPSDAQSVLKAETDSKGAASFELPEPAPAHIGVQVRLRSENFRCPCNLLASTNDVLGKGMMLGSFEKATASPGEVLFVARPLGFFERLFQPLMRE